MISLFLISLPARAAEVEVSPGDDIATLTASLAAGSEIVFNDGVYTLGSALTWTGQGTEDAPIVLRAKEGATPILEFTADAWIGAYITEASYLEVRGLSFRGAEGWETDNAYGVEIKDSSNVTLKDCTIGQFGATLLYLAGNNTALTITGNELHDSVSGAGIYIGCSDASCWTAGSTISGNWIHGLQGTSAYGIYLAPGGQGNTLADNVIHDTNYRGLRVDSTEYGDPNTVEGNVLWNVNEVGMDIRGGSRVRNNVVFNVEGVGLRSAANDRDTLDDVVISFNTVVNTTGYAVYIEEWDGRTGNVLANNALCNPTGYGLYVEDEGDTGEVELGLFTGNVVCGLADTPASLAGTFTAGGGYDDFVDPEGWDFYPSAGSHLKDAADPSGETWVPDEDFNGAPRDGGSPDVGAYEWSGADNPGWDIQEDFKESGYTAGPGEEVGGGCCGEDGEKSALLALPALLGAGALRRRRARPGPRIG